MNRQTDTFIRVTISLAIACVPPFAALALGGRWTGFVIWLVLGQAAAHLFWFVFAKVRQLRRDARVGRVVRARLDPRVLSLDGRVSAEDKRAIAEAMR